MGDGKKGIVTFRDTTGQDFIIISDGNHEVIDHNKFKKLFKLKSDKLGLKDIRSMKDITDKNAEVKDKLDKLNIKSLGITLDLTMLDDHIKSKDFTVWAKKVMNHSFFKSLTRFPAKMVLMIAFMGFFMGASLLFIFEFVVMMLYLIARLII